MAIDRDRSSCALCLLFEGSVQKALFHVELDEGGIGNVIRNQLQDGESGFICKDKRRFFTHPPKLSPKEQRSLFGDPLKMFGPRLLRMTATIQDKGMNWSISQSQETESTGGG